MDSNKISPFQKADTDYTKILYSKILGNYILGAVSNNRLKESILEDIAIGTLEFYKTGYFEEDGSIDYANYQLDCHMYNIDNMKCDLRIGATVRYRNRLWILDNIYLDHEILEDNYYQKNLKAAWLLEEMQMIQNIVRIETDKKKIDPELIEFYNCYGFAPMYTDEEGLI